MQTFFGSIVSDEQGWLTVLVAFPLICLALWGSERFQPEPAEKGEGRLFQEEDSAGGAGCLPRR